MITVLAVGCFDCLHPGHVAHLKAARNLGDCLIVGLTIDAMVSKGEGRPAFPWRERAAMLEELRCVNDVVQNVFAKSTIIEIKPDIYVKGKEYEGRLSEQALVESCGGKVVFLDTQPVYSSTDILGGALLARRRSGQESSIHR